MALVFGTRNAYLIDTGRLDYKPLIGHDHTVRLCTSASCCGIPSVELRAKPITSYHSLCVSTGSSQQLISEKNPVPILRGAAVRKLRHPSPAFTFDCPKNSASRICFLPLSDAAFEPPLIIMALLVWPSRLPTPQ